MKHLVFYEKPGCLGNKRQKEGLSSEGFTLEVRSILDEDWKRETLRPFLEARPVSEWFNVTAPAVKNGEIKPEVLSAEEALDIMILDPILIRRPLIEYSGEKICGYDDYVMYDVLGLSKGESDMERCQDSDDSCNSV